MRQIPLNLMTLYADLVQNALIQDTSPASIATKSVKGRRYVYATRKDGGTRQEKYLGPADDPRVQEEVELIRRAAARSKHLRNTVTLLKRGGIPGPVLPLARLLETVANAGLFRDGVLLVGTAAYQVYPCIVGAYLSSSALMTNDADLLVASLLSRDEPLDIEAILKRADPTFAPVMSVTDKLPKVFRASNNFQVDILTKYGRGRKSPVPIVGLGCAAEALSYMEYLAEESIEAVALYNTGVLVRVPPPMRFASHKLLIAQERSASFRAKKLKDLAQASELIDIFIETDESNFQGVLDEARARGRQWKKNINTSLAELRRDTRQGYPPLPVTPALAAKKR